jgi:low affinity Fe/Cu permease
MRPSYQVSQASPQSLVHSDEASGRTKAFQPRCKRGCADRSDDCSPGASGSEGRLVVDRRGQIPMEASMSVDAKQGDKGKKGKGVSHLFGNFANMVARAAGRPLAFITATIIVVIWGVTGPMFHYSDTWQLVINTGTTIVTFLMVFLIQNSQNRDNAAIQVKLDELIRVSEVKNLFVGIERLTDEEIEDLRIKCEDRAKRDGEEAVRVVGRRAAAAADAVG